MAEDSSNGEGQGWKEIKSIPQKGQQTIELIRWIVREWRHGKKELALVMMSLVILGVAQLIPEADDSLPEPIPLLWSLVPLLLTMAGVFFLSWAFIHIFRLATAPLPKSAAKPSAIKGVASFGPQDGELFSKLERNLELAKLRDWVLDPRVRLIMVEGTSGVGKTSLLRSGLGHRLGGEAHVFYCEAMPSEPDAGILRAVRDWGGPSPPAKLDDLLVDDGTRRVVVLDQAEQLSETRHAEVFKLLKRVLAPKETSTTKWVVAYRLVDDRMDWRSFEVNLPQGQRNRVENLILKGFSHDSAERVISVLVEESDIGVEAKVVTEIVEGVAENGRVSPVDIGISLLALSELADHGDGPLSVETFHTAGGQEGLLTAYLHKILARLGEPLRDEVLETLLHLADRDRIRRRAEGMEIEDLIQSVDPVHLDRFCKSLEFLASQRARVLEIVPGTKTKFRITHERLIPAIRRLTGDTQLEVDRARRDLDEHYVAWFKNRQFKHLLSGAVLRRGLEQQNQFLWLDADAPKKDFIQRSIHHRSKRRGAFIGILAILVVVVVLAVSWVRVEMDRTALKSWNLPVDLYEYQEQLEALSLPGVVNQIDWIRSNRLKSLDLSKCEILSFKGLPSSLESLRIGGSKIEELPDLPDSLTRLSVWAGGLIGLTRLPPSLIELDLSSTKVLNLHGLPRTLKSLDLSNTGIDSLEDLPPSLTTLILWGTEVSDLKDFPSGITTLDIGSTNVVALKDLPSRLVELNLRSTFIESLADDLPVSLRVLDLSYSSQLASLKGLPAGVKDLDLSYTTLSSLQDLPQGVEVLKIRQTRITDLSDLPPRLQELEVDTVRRWPTEWPSTLRELNLSYSHLAALKGLPANLESLDLSGNNKLQLLTGLPPTLKKLNLSDTFFSSLEGLPESLESLNLSRTEINQLSSLGSKPNLVILDLSNTDVASLEGLPWSLKILNLRSCKVSNLDNLPDGLEVLDLSGNPVRSLKGLPSSLKELTLHVGQVDSLAGLPASVTRLNFVDRLNSQF